MKEKIKIITGIILFAVCLIFGLIIAFTNPDMTQIRLLITYWKEYIGMFILMTVGYFLIMSGLNES